MEKQIRLFISPGEPAGIGPDILINVAQKNWKAELISVCDPELLRSRADSLGLPLQLTAFNGAQFNPHQPGTLSNIPIKQSVASQPGILNSANVNYVLECIETATLQALEYHMPLVTGPIQKSIIQERYPDFQGHTEFLAKLCHVPQSIMLFVAREMKLALATTHIPLSQVPIQITKDLLINTIRLLHSELVTKFHIKDPTILVSGLNPHAGEQGHLGTEEQETIEPAIQFLQNNNMRVIGPLPADTLFTEKYVKMSDAILVMYHDQGLPVIKYLGFGEAVNVTLGLPIMRTSVDHGTALDMAGTGQANPGSLISAINLAIRYSIGARNPI